MNQIDSHTDLCEIPSPFCLLNCLPLSYGGKVEQGEDILVAAIREVREESGLVVNPQTVRLVGKFTG